MGWRRLGWWRKGISLACLLCFACLLALGALKCFHCLACGVMNWAISFLSPRVHAKRDLSGWTLYVSTYYLPSSFFANPFSWIQTWRTMQVNCVDHANIMLPICQNPLNVPSHNPSLKSWNGSILNVPILAPFDMILTWARSHRFVPPPLA
jgi:hypothetical protein